jgi:hypothetical protein
MKVPDQKLNFIMSMLRSIGKGRIGNLAETCANALMMIGQPQAVKVSLTLPGLEPETSTSPRERHVARLESIMEEHYPEKRGKHKQIPEFVSITLDDGLVVAFASIKFLGRNAGLVAALGDDSQIEDITLPEAVWLCTSQMTSRIHNILSPKGPMAVEILGRRILQALRDNGVNTLTIGPAIGDETWVSLHRSGDKTESREIERLPQDQVAAINNGEIIGENTMKYLWSDHNIALGIWISSEAGYSLAVGFEEPKVPTPLVIGRIRDQIESSARSDYEYLIKSFEKLKGEFDRLVKSERAAAITETTVTISHEINNPLTAILGNTQLLLMSKEKLAADIVSKLETIERSAVKIRETTAKLMSIIEPVTTPYVSGLEMIDIEKSKKKSSK